LNYHRDTEDTGGSEPKRVRRGRLTYVVTDFVLLEEVAEGEGER
jgi:hypothetical protein